MGSSPLARGLLTAYQGCLCVLGIIPARAGFTFIFSFPSDSGEDHPRSRGVYHSSPLLSVFLRGSSPLARGLQIETMGFSHSFGIIPARAGFTGRSCGWHAPRSDHPRSRGVYWPVMWVARATVGSSPLARGLLWGSPTTGVYKGSSPLARGLRGARFEPGAQERIIPARAGFTFHYFLSFSSPTDHPRSRGVYFRAGST